jgi:hypothetical protein
MSIRLDLVAGEAHNRCMTYHRNAITIFLASLLLCLLGLAHATPADAMTNEDAKWGASLCTIDEVKAPGSMTICLLPGGDGF